MVRTVKTARAHRHFLAVRTRVSCVSLLLSCMLAVNVMASKKNKPEKILLDTDIGTDVDDALALVLAARSPEIELVSVTTTGGKPETRALIASRILTLLNRSDILVAAGLARPLPSERFQQLFPEGLWLGHEGEGLLTSGEVSDVRPTTGLGAVDQIIATLRSAKEKLTVVTIGPVSNLGAALQKDPGIADKIKRFIVMGGNVMRPPQIGGHEMSPLMEFNLNADREAASILLASGVPVILVPVELTLQTYLTESDVKELRSGDRTAQALARLIDVWRPIFHKLYRSFKVPEAGFREMACHLHDVLAILPLVDPSLLKFENVYISPREEKGIFVTRLTEGTMGTKAKPEGGLKVTVATFADNNKVRRFTVQRLLGHGPGNK